MTHEEIVKELRKIGKYLQSKAKDIKARYGETPEFEDEVDKADYELLMDVCQAVREPQSVIPYIELGLSRRGVSINKGNTLVIA